MDANATQGAVKGAIQKQPVIVRQLGEIENRINGLFGIANQIDGGLNRMLSPRPAECPTASAPPTPQTIEARLDATLRQLEMLATNLCESANRLDSAV